MKTASGGAGRWWIIPLLISAHAAVCVPVGESSVRMQPCPLLISNTATRLRAEKWKTTAVVYAVEEKDLSATIETAGADVCEGTATLQFGAVVDVWVLVLRHVPLAVVMDTNVADNETVMYMCQDSSTGCVQLMNRAQDVKFKRSATSEGLVSSERPGMRAPVLSVVCAVAALLALTAALALCAKKNSSYDPIPLSAATADRAQDGPQAAGLKPTQTGPVNTTTGPKLTISTASDDVPLLDEGRKEEVVGGTPDGAISVRTAEVTATDTHTPPGAHHTPPGAHPLVSGDNAGVAKKLEEQAKICVATENIVVEDGFPYASVSSSKPENKSKPPKVEASPVIIAVEDGFPYASVSSSKPENKSEPLKVEASPMIIAVEDGFPYASVSSSKPENKSEPPKVEASPMIIAVEDGFPYTSVLSVATNKAVSMQPSKTEATVDTTSRHSSPSSSGHLEKLPNKSSESAKAEAASIIKVVSDGYPYASVSDKTKADNNPSRVRSLSQLPEPFSTTSTLSPHGPHQSSRSRSLTSPEPPTVAAPSTRHSVHQPLPDIPRQRSDLFEELYDSIPEDQVGNSEHRPGEERARPIRLYESLKIQEGEKKEGEGGEGEEMYESVPDQLKVLDLARATPTPPGSPKGGGVVSPRKGGAHPEGRKRAFTFFKWSRKDSPEDHASPFSSPHHGAITFPAPSYHPTEEPLQVHSKVAKSFSSSTETSSSSHRKSDKTMSLPSSMREAGLSGMREAGLPSSTRAHLPLPELPEDSGSGSSAAVVGPKPRALEPDDPGYDLVPGGEETTVRDDDPEYDTVTRVQQDLEDIQSINLAGEEAMGEEPGYDSVRREGIPEVQGAQAGRALEDDPGYSKVKKEGTGEEVDMGEEPGYAKVGVELLQSILANHHGDAAEQVTGAEVVTLGYAKVTKPLATSKDASSLTVPPQDEAGYTVVPLDSKSTKKGEPPVTSSVCHDDHGYAVVPPELKEARRRAASVGQAKRASSLKRTMEQATAPSGEVGVAQQPAATPSASDVNNGLEQEGKSTTGGGDGLYSKVDVELKHELRKQRHESDPLSPFLVISSPDPKSPVVPPLSSSITLEFPDLDSPPVPQYSEDALELVTGGPSGAAGQPSSPLPPEGEAGYAVVGSRAVKTEPLPLDKDASGYDTVVEVGGGQRDVSARLQRTEMIKEQLEDKASGYDVVGSKLQ